MSNVKQLGRNCGHGTFRPFPIGQLLARMASKISEPKKKKKKKANGNILRRRFTDEQIIKLRDDYARRGKQTAAEFAAEREMSPLSLGKIMNGENYSWVP